MTMTMRKDALGEGKAHATARELTSVLLKGSSRLAEPNKHEGFKHAH